MRGKRGHCGVAYHELWLLCRDTRRPTFTNSQHGAGVCCIAWHPGIAGLAATGSYDKTVRLWDERAMHRPLAEAACGGGVWRLSWEPCASASMEEEGAASSLLAAACMHGGCRVLLASDLGSALDAGPIGERAGCGDPVLGTSISPRALRARCSLTVTHSFESHESLAYGIDWLRSVPSDGASPLAGSADQRSAAALAVEDGAGAGSSCLDAAAMAPAFRPHNNRKGLISCSFYDRSMYMWRLDAANATA